MMATMKKNGIIVDTITLPSLVSGNIVSFVSYQNLELALDSYNGKLSYVDVNGDDVILSKPSRKNPDNTVLIRNDKHLFGTADFLQAAGIGLKKERVKHNGTECWVFELTI